VYRLKKLLLAGQFVRIHPLASGIVPARVLGLTGSSAIATCIKPITAFPNVNTIAIQTAENRRTFFIFVSYPHFYK
jgi:hypothetical protein